jgi:hypothetical protein
MDGRTFPSRATMLGTRAAEPLGRGAAGPGSLSRFVPAYADAVSSGWRSECPASTARTASV